MGECTSVNCAACGYSAGVTYGGAKSTPREDFVSPFVCSDCHEVTSVYINRTPLACRKCGSLKISPLDVPQRPSEPSDFDVVGRIFSSKAFRAKFGEDLPSYECIIAAPRTAKVPPTPDGRQLVSYMLACRVSENDAKAAFRYMERLEKEFQALFVVQAFRRNHQLSYNTEFGHWCSTHTSEDWSSQIEGGERKLATLRRTLEEQLSLSASNQPTRYDDQSKFEDGGKCPRCGAMAFYLEPAFMMFD
jgi:hypothetical protein